MSDFDPKLQHHLALPELESPRPMTTKTEEIGPDVLLLAEYGSRACGTATDDSDHDLMGIFLETDAQIYGLAEARTRQSDLGRRSTSADTDVTLHPLRKYVSLAAGGNPTALSLLWSPETLIEKITPAASLLIEHRELFVTRRAITAHMGYAISQRKTLTGERTTRTNRPELVEKFGYDTKFAMHLLRLLIQGQELVESRRYSLPIAAEHLTLLRSIRQGLLTLDDVLALAQEHVDRLRAAEMDSSLPERPDPDRENQLLIDARRLALATPPA